MLPHLFYYQLVLIALVWLCVILHGLWPSDPVATCSTTLEGSVASFHLGRLWGMISR